MCFTDVAHVRQIVLAVGGLVLFHRRAVGLRIYYYAQNSTYYSILLFWKTLPIIPMKSPIILLQTAKNKALSMYRITYGLRLGVYVKLRGVSQAC